MGISREQIAPKGRESTVSEGSSGAFDFLLGEWVVRHRKLRHRLANCTDWHEFPGTLQVSFILDGLGNFDRNRLEDPDGSYEAHSLRLYSPDTQTWSIWWLDGRWPSLGPPVVGSFEGRKGVFFGDDEFQGKSIIVRTTYEPLTSHSAQWTQAFWNADTGTWEVNWIMDFHRPSLRST